MWNRGGGEAPEEAEAAARREFGNRTLIEELTREVWGWGSLERLWQDVRYALRGMRRSPAFTAVAVLSLALGIGANTAIFSLIHTLMLRLLPVREPQQLVEFLNQYPGDPFLNAFSWRSYEHFRDHNHVFSDIAADRPSRFSVRGEGLDAEIIDGERVSGSFFSTLGVRPAIGRLIGPEDDRAGEPVAVVSWPLWKSRFNLDSGILGKRIVVDNAPVTIVGVLPRGFTGLQLGFRPDIWMPLGPGCCTAPVPSPQGSGLRLIARLKPGTSIAQARAEMSVLFPFTVEERVAQNASESRRALERQLRFAVEPAGAGVSTALREQFAKPLLALMALVALLLLIACTNVAGMLLARGAARRREMALRVCLGAGRLRLVRQVLTESLLLAAAGAALGVFLAYFGARALVGIMTSGRFIGPRPHIEIPTVPDVHVLLFTAGIAILTAVLFGLAPLRGARTAGEKGKSRRTFGKSLVAAQVALSVGLLSTAWLFIRNLAALEHMDLGFRRDHVLLVALDPARSGLKDEPLARAYQDLLARMRQIPGVRSATISGPGPLSGAGGSRFVNVEGSTERSEDRRYVSLAWVAPDYFQTLGTPLLAGRDFRFEDRGRPRVAIVNQALARYYFRDANPIGRYLTFEGEATPYEIVGVAGDAKYYEMREPALRTIYLNTFQFPRPESAFALRTSANPEAIVPSVRRAVREVLKDVPLVRVTTLSDQVNATIVPERLIATLSGFFGALGSLLGAIGMYGLLAYTVARRVNEIGIRMALGATETAISRMVLAEALGVTGAGLLIGAPLAWWGSRVAASLIPDLPAASAVPVALGIGTTIAIALVAAWLPARRAARVDPMDALRHE